MRAKRFILAAVGIILASGAGLTLALLIVYHHPSVMTRLIEDALSARFGVAVTIGALEYGLQPMQVGAAHIVVRGVSAGEDLHLSVSKLNAAFALEGPVGRRTLVIERITLSGVKLTAEGRLNWRDIIPDARPPSALNRLAAHGVAALLFRDVRLGSVALSGTEAVLRTDALQAAFHRLRADTTPDGIRVEGQARIQWPAAGAAVDVPQFDAMLNLDLSADRNVFSGHLHMPDARYTSAQARAAASRAEVDLALTLGPERITIEDGRVRSRSLTLQREGMAPLALHAPRLSAAGAFTRRQGVLKLRHWQLAVDELVDLGGEAEFTLGAARALDIQRIEGTLFPAKMIPQLFPDAGTKRAPVQVFGPVGISGRLVLKETAHGMIEDGDVTATFDQNTVTAAVGAARVEGVITGTVQGRGRAVSPRIAARLSGRQIRLSGTGVGVAPFAVDVSAEGAYPAFAIPRLEIRIPAAAVPVSGASYPLKDIFLRAAGATVRADTMSVSFPEIMVDSDVLHNLTGSLTGDLRQMTVDVSGSETGWIAAAGRFQLLPPGWRIGGADRLQARAVIRPDGESRLFSTVETGGLSFADAGQRGMGEDIALRAEITARMHPREDALAVVASVHAGGGELLWDRYYLNAGKNPVTLTADLRYEMSGRRLQINSARIDLAHLLTLDVAGHLVSKASETACDLTLQAPPTPAAPLFAAVIAEPLRYYQPTLAAMQVDGQLSARVHVAADGRRRAVRGVVDWRSGSAVTADQTVRLEDISLRLPLLLQSDGEDMGAAPMKGELTVGRVTVPMLPTQALDLPFEVRRNQLSTTGEVRIRFPAGEARLGTVSVSDPFSPDPTIKTRLTLERVQVGGFLKGLWSSPVDAVVNGELADIVFDGRDVHTRGRLVADIFKGKIIVQDPGVDAAFSTARNIRADCLIQDVSLAEATLGTSFGRIQGVLGGRVEHLEIVGGQPQRFTLLLETKRTRGIPQRINVTAVENIARIGGGQSPFIGLAGNLVSFFKEFTYDHIGVRAILENDRFKINGTIKEGGVEYLVKRGGIPGVDVVNLNPANQISFKDMVRRIRRVTESKSGPVVN